MIAFILASILTFDQLSSAPQPQEVTMRGFLYQQPDKSWVLAAEPQLKSCCIGAPHTVQRQVFVEGVVGQPKAGYVYTLRGIFEKDPVRDGSGKLVRLYHLRQAAIQ